MVFNFIISIPDSKVAIVDRNVDIRDSNFGVNEWEFLSKNRNLHITKCCVDMMGGNVAPIKQNIGVSDRNINLPDRDDGSLDRNLVSLTRSNF